MKDSVFPLKEKRIATAVTRLRNDGGGEKRIAAGLKPLAMTRGEKTAVLRLLLYIIPHYELRIPHYFIIMVLKKQTAAKNSRLFLSLAVIRLFRQRIRKPLHRRL